MALFSARFLTYLRICFLLTCAFNFVQDPDYLFKFPFAILLAKAMELPFVEINQDSLIFGTLAILMVLQAVSDLIPLLEQNQLYFDSIVPTRLVLFFGIATYCCLGKNFFICNNVVFLYCFFEISFNILIYSSLREEKYKRQQEEQETREIYEELNLEDDGERTGFEYIIEKD